MTTKGSATKAMFNAIAKDTSKRAKAWFADHPEEPYCYWARDEFISIEDRDNPEILARHPEIEDINDHTTVYLEKGLVVIRTFCPRLREGISDFYNDGVFSGEGWVVEPELDNWKVTLA